MPRKSKVVRELEHQLSYAQDARQLAEFNLRKQADEHKKELEKVRVQVHEKRIELATRLINAIGQTQESIARPLAMLLDSPGF